MEAVRRKLLPNPRENANIFSILLFWWTKDVFTKGYKNVFGLSDLCQPLQVDRSENLGDRLEKQWNIQLKNCPEKPSFKKAVAATFWREFVFLAILFGLNDLVLRLTQPYLLGQFLLYFKKDSTMTFKDGLFYGTALMGVTIMAVIMVSQLYLQCFHVGMKLRISACSLIYRKALRLSQTALGVTAPGKVINLLSNHVSRLDMFTVFLNSLWTAPLMCIIIGYLLWKQVEWPGLFGLLVVIMVLPVQIYTTKFSAKYRALTATRTDERSKLMDEVIAGIQVIKMLAWEVPFGKLINYARKMELKIVQKSSYIRGLYMTFLLFTTRMAVFCTMLSIALLYGTTNLTASNIFVVTMYFNLLSHVMTQMFARGIADLAEVSVTFKAIENFLNYEEKPIEKAQLTQQEFQMENGEKTKIFKPQTNMPSDVVVSIKNATMSNDLTPATLDNIDINIKTGQLIGIIGPVGAGKSSFLQAILRELPLEYGSINVYGSCSYAGQVPWIFGGSIRQNILFGQEMNREIFDEVIEACDLTTDFEQLSNGELTIIGERGASLSGGQKARINLARAAYKNADIYLLDDPLSAVDTNVGRNLFNKCIGPHGNLTKHGAARILVTHQMHFLKEADWVIVMKNGKVEDQGSPSDLSKKGVDFTELKTESTSENDHNPKTPKTDLEIKQSTRSPQNNAKETVQQLEASSKGKVQGSISRAYFSSGNNPLAIFCVCLLFGFTQLLASCTDYWVAIWTSQEELRLYYNQQNDTNISVNVMTNNSVNLRFNNTKNNFGSFENYFDDFGLLTIETCIYIHAGLIAAVFIFGLIRSFGFLTLCVRASKKLHSNMFQSIISTAMHFFNSNPSGRILNRFCKDMGTVDEMLPRSMLDAIHIILLLCGSVILAAIVNPLFLIPFAVLAGILVYVRKIYLQTAMNLRRLDGMTRSPVFTHISVSLNGLSTIRAFNAESVLINEFDNHQDLHTACWFSFISVGSAFGLSLDVICFTFVLFITYSFLLIDQGILSDKVGLAITQVISLAGVLQWGIRQSSEVISQMMAVERILEYRDLEPETQPEKPTKVPKNWPHEGKVEFYDVSYKYSPDAEPVLSGLNFVVQPKEKVGIVGRTGAGKTSLVGAIFRMAIVEGKILIDDIDTSTLRLQDLRSKIAIIPQDPVLFWGTLRRNLDPIEEYSDADIWLTLESVELKDITGTLGLQTVVAAGGSNFSVGQRQLLCLARALLRKNQLLILDEATANVDTYTDQLIQRTLREKFSNCTVLTIAHRLNTIIDLDRVLVIDSGKIIEFDTPHLLLQNKLGMLMDMVNALGPQESEKLIKAAEEKHASLHKIA